MPVSAQTLFDSVRRYCRERIDLWTKRQGELDQKGAATVDEAYTEEALALFPRSEVMRALLHRIEELPAEDFDDPNEIARIFEEVARSVQDGFAPPFCQDLERGAADAECSLFLDYLRDLSARDSNTSIQDH